MTEIKNPTANDIGGASGSALSAPQTQDFLGIIDEKLIEIIEKVKASNPEQYKFFQPVRVEQLYCKPYGNHREEWTVILGEVRTIVKNDTESQCAHLQELILVPLTEVVVVYHRGRGGDWNFDVLYVFSTQSGWWTIEVNGVFQR
jgi:hypothetical protein